jgi:transmembrane sensor
MLELEQLMQKFWANETTPAENRRLLQLIEQHRVEVKDSMQENFQERQAGGVPGLQPDKAMSILQKIHGRLGIADLMQQQQRRTAVIRRLYRSVAVAASVVIIAGAVFLLTGGHREKGQIVKAAAPVAPRLMRLVNTQDSAMTFTLKDGSTVQLEKNSSLSYYEPFINNRRDLSLNGIALFKVAKDKTKPFTVYAGGIATTALGTRFWVNAEDNKKIKVRLLEGKVMVNAATGSGLAMNDVYLRPGEEFSFDKNSREYTVHTMGTSPVNAGKIAPAEDRPELIFKKEPLSLVFERVGHLYNIPISFHKEELDGLYFTGTFLKSDNWNIVLSTICNVNDLLVTKDGDSITITRSH